MITCHEVRVQRKSRVGIPSHRAIGLGPSHWKGQERLTGGQLTIDEAIEISMTYLSTVSKMEQIDG